MKQDLGKPKISLFACRVSLLPVCWFGLSTLLIITHLVLREGFGLALRARVEHWWVLGVLVFDLLGEGVVLALLSVDSCPTMLWQFLWPGQGF